MSKKLYVGSLPYDVSEDQLRGLFEPFGAIESVRIISDKYTGQSRGFGFVEMGDEEAQRAIEGVNGKEMGGRTLIVNEARPEQPRERSFGGGGGGGRGGRGGGGGRGGFGGRSGGDRGGGRNRW